MANLPTNPVIGETVLEDFEWIDFDDVAYQAAMEIWRNGGGEGPQPLIEAYPLSLGIKTKVYFWNGLCWLQWVDGRTPVNVFIEEGV